VEIAAVVHGTNDAAIAGTLSCVDAQTRPPDQVIVATAPRHGAEVRRRFGARVGVVSAPNPLAAAGERSVAGAADWIWLLEAGTLPAADAVAALLERAESWPDGRICVLSSKLVDADGALLAMQAPMPQALDPDLAADAFERRTCSLRNATYGSLLVRAAVLRDLPPTVTGPGADLIWSARVLGSGVGLLVPSSLAVGVRATTLRLLAGWARLLLSDAVPAREKPWIGFIYAERSMTLIANSVRALLGGEPRPEGPSK
jgi:hypothetical protein